ncbi:MAG TPA: AAA family ATPase [Candidatus Omnitrophica bacterium]|nr:MAG: transposase [Candidatus Omnitrophota bacterium]RKY43819.1 MAG: transposase [Candidatus Omnitrophota bacterium]HEC69948.1 AAA family ATPase [Candidatus Omnitrophota bacterium]
MSYYKILGFKKEPFSTSPDPEFLYLAKDHDTVLVNTLIELRLRRGLSVILGDIGTGKTSLSRKLIQELSQREDFIFHMVLDPGFLDEEEFLKYLLKNFGTEANSSSLIDLKETLEKFLFQKGVIEDKTVVLIIDEAQKLNPNSLETLRILLNYETNEFKLLQLVLLGQLELHTKIMSIPNFLDRISFKYTLNPLSKKETAEMIEFRVRKAGYSSKMHLFLDEAIEEIYNYTKGYPRRITLLCHKALKELILRNRFVVDAKLVLDLIEKEKKTGWYSQLTLPKAETGE